MSLDGALALQARFAAQTKTDDKALHAAAVAMKKGADKQSAASGKKDNGSTAAVADDDGAFNALGLSIEIIELSPFVLGVVSILCPPLGIALALSSATVLVGAYVVFVAFAVAGLTALVGQVVTNFTKNVGTDSGRDDVSVPEARRRGPAGVLQDRQQLLSGAAGDRSIWPATRSGPRKRGSV